MAFGKQIRDLRKNYDEQLDKTRRAIIFELVSSFIGDTRVKTGRAKGNWQTTVSSPATGTLQVEDKEGSAARSKAKDNMGKNGDTVWITNNLPYIGNLERLDAMMSKNLARINSIIKRKAAEYKK